MNEQCSKTIDHTCKTHTKTIKNTKTVTHKKVFDRVLKHFMASCHILVLKISLKTDQCQQYFL